MSEIGEIPAMHRRTLLRAAILLVGGSIVGLPGDLLAQTGSAGPKFFTPAQYAILTAVAETIIPKTDTPGAKEAGVPKNLDSLMVAWASKERQAQFRALVDAMDVATRSAAGVPLTGRPAAERLEAVRAFDEQRLTARDEVYAKFKELVLTLYYFSEVGATKELRYELIPGKWEPGIEIKSDTRAWAV